jgi:hypothetical protein
MTVLSWIISIASFWFVVGFGATLFTVLFEYKTKPVKRVINDPIDFLIGVAIWPLMLVAIKCGIPSTEKLKKKTKIIVLEDGETEEAFANRCKRL